MSIETHTRKVAIVHDWLVAQRGGEKVLEAILELFPGADVYTLFYSPERCSDFINRHRIIPSTLNKIPFFSRKYQTLLPLFPMVIENFNLLGYDLVISSSHCVAKGVITNPKALHISYCHSPMRYVWDKEPEYFGQHPLRWLMKPFLHYLRMWDVTSSARVDQFIANSAFVAKRIEKFYRRESQIIHPFVDLELFTKNSTPRSDSYLIVSELVPYKRVEIAVQACQKLGRKLIVVGNGARLEFLKRIAGAETQFLGGLSSQDLIHHYSNAKALLFPGEEDFGITPLEAMACGTPVIAFGQGGLTETVIANETGIFFHEQTVESMVEAILAFEAKEFSPDKCRARAEQFSKTRFQQQLGIVIARSE